MAKITIDRMCCKGCDICIAICPKKIFVSSKKRNSYGTNMPEAQNTNECVGCGLCESLCPDGAINVDLEVEADEN
jgi:2-oxoglutarate ferredoxin oxidoreductase subunit delta